MTEMGYETMDGCKPISGFTTRPGAKLRHPVGPKRMLLVLVLGACGLFAACASTGPIESRTSAADAAKAARADAQKARQTPGDAESGSEQETNRSLDFARVVLEREGGDKLDAEQREGVARALVSAESEHGISVILALAMMQLESRFDPHAKGPAGSIGLMQLQPATARAVARRHGFRWESSSTLLDPETNARLGLAYLAELRSRFGSTDHAVAAYNIGPGNLRRLLARRPLDRGPYLTKVYAHIDALREEYQN